MPIEELPESFPNIYRHYQEAGVGWGAMERLHDDTNMSLPALDRALEAVGVGGGAVVRGLSADLFSDDLDKVLAAICEFLAFGWLTQHAGLVQASIGYPGDWLGEDPPFEGVLRNQGAELAFDVKDGSGSGLALIREVLQGQVDAYAGNGNQSPRVHVALNAPTGQRWVNENFNRIVRPFREELEARGLAARRLRYDAGSGHIQVGIGTAVGGSIVGLREKASFIARQIIDHARHKAAQLRRTAAGSFLLVYVRRPGSGLSDFSEETVTSAADFLAGRADLPATFSGILFLDFDHGDSQDWAHALCWDRYGTISPLWGGHARAYAATPAVTPEARNAAARGLAPADLEATAAILMGSCELRGGNCLAPGSAGPVFVFFHRDEQYVCCQRCRDQFRWPGPGV